MPFVILNSIRKIIEILGTLTKIKDNTNLRVAKSDLAAEAASGMKLVWNFILVAAIKPLLFETAGKTNIRGKRNIIISFN